MPEFDVTPDEIVKVVAPHLVDRNVAADGDVAADRDVVVFHGWLSGECAGVYRLFTSAHLNEWLEIPKADLRYQLPGKDREDSISVIWVTRKARLVKSHQAEACEFAEAETELDPATDDGARRRWPRYP